jgi:hypothetical protein
MSDSDYDEDIADDWELEAQREEELERQREEQRKRDAVAADKRQREKVAGAESVAESIEVSHEAKQAMDHAQRLDLDQRAAADLFSEQQNAVKFSDRLPATPAELAKYGSDLAEFISRYQGLVNFDKTLEVLFKNMTNTAKLDLLNEMLRTANIASENAKKKKPSSTKDAQKKATDGSHATEAISLDNDDKGGAANADYSMF